MKLPIEVSDDDGILTKNGTMIYGKEDDRTAGKTDGR